MARLIALAFAVLTLAACGGDDEPDRGDERDRPAGGGEPGVTVVAEGLEAPWEIAFLPDGRALVTERPGRVRLLSADGELRPEPVAEIEVSAVGEGGLLGMAVDPDFGDNRFVYLYGTREGANEVARYRLDGDRLEEDAAVISGIPAGSIHNGGRIHFGPDERLYVATGDAGDAQLSQDEGSLAGKILRMGPRAYRGEGGRPEVHSMGHRNPQGFDWEPESDRLVASEHGQSANDEINVIEEGENYGWPVVEGPDHGRFRAPVRAYEEVTIAPSGATFVTEEGSAWSGDFLIAGLRGEQLRRVTIEGDQLTRDDALFDGRFGRLRTVVEGPDDDALYVLTNNRDGRGSPEEGDDRVVRIVPPR